MQRHFTLILLFVHFTLLWAKEKEYHNDYTLFENSLMESHYFYSSATYSKSSHIKNVGGNLPVSKNHFFTPPNAIELDYVNGEEGKWEASIKAENLRGNDLFPQSDTLSFWIYPDRTRKDLYPDISLVFTPQKATKTVHAPMLSNKVSIKDYLVNPKRKKGWLQIKIPLGDLTKPPLENSLMDTCFGSVKRRLNALIFSGNNNKGKGKLFIDQVELSPFISYIEIPPPEKIIATGYELHVDISWQPIQNKAIKYIKIYRSEDNKIFHSIGIQRPSYYNRYTDFTGKTNRKYYYKISYIDYQYNETSFSATAHATTRPFDDNELLDMVQEASFRYYWEGAEPHSGLARENIPGRKNMIATGASGFGIMAIIVGTERNFITREQAIQRMKKIVKFLANCDKYHGAVSHFMDGTTGKTTAFFGEHDNGGDLVETAFLFQGLLVALQYFDRNNANEKEIRQTITKLWKAVEWDWYDREKEKKFLTWHWSKDHQWIIDHKLIGWNETMIVYILGIASPTHPIDASMYYNGWASQEEKAAKYRKAWGQTDDGSFYTNNNYYHGIQLDVGVAKGGPLFFIHYSYMGLDPHTITDHYTNYFENNKKIALINWRYCTENPNNRKGFNRSFWGITASDGPWGYKALEPRKEIEDGTLAPTGALASFPYTPEQSMSALKNMYRNHGHYMWGEYGFRDAVNLNQNWQSRIFMGLNQAPVTVMIENYRSRLIWELFLKNNEIKKALNEIKQKK